MTTKTVPKEGSITRVTRPRSNTTKTLKSSAHTMPKEETIFITYNPGNEFERTIAARLHTIGAVNDFRMYMPDRFNSETVLDEETKRRIENSDYIILFSMGKISKIVKHELNYAFDYFKDKSKIIIIHDKHQEKPLDISREYFTVVEFDYLNDNQDEFVKRVIHAIKPAGSKSKKKTKNVTSEIADNMGGVIAITALTAIIIIGLGLLLLSLLKKEE